ncbi:MAG: hypothetical protein B6D68_00815 [spirochete symbiont of Stewartia floridana]|nr:MAG: hypothetical protein B6D68_00815 [spirochete symbiont of Stewartia floridana]
MDKTKLKNRKRLLNEVSEEENRRVLVRAESKLGGRRIIVKQHEEDARCIVYELGRSSDSHLILIK